MKSNQNTHTAKRDYRLLQLFQQQTLPDNSPRVFVLIPLKQRILSIFLFIEIAQKEKKYKNEEINLNGT